MRATILMNPMNPSSRTINIGIALGIVCVLLAGSFFLSSRTGVQVVDAESTSELLASYAKKDTDGDGLPDWQEVIYGTDPADAHSADKTLTDKEAFEKGLLKPKFETEVAATDLGTVPGIKAGPETLTDKFAREFFTQYLQGRGATQPTQEELLAFVNDSVDSLRAENVKKGTYTTARVNGTGPDALRAYAAAAEQTFAAYTITTEKSELLYLADAIDRNDANAKNQIVRIAGAYANIAKGLINVPVPTEAASAHIAVVNALARMGGVIEDMSMLDKDPLRAFVGIDAYQESVDGLVSALGNLYVIFAAEGVVIPEGNAGYSYYNLLLTSKGTGQ